MTRLPVSTAIRPMLLKMLMLLVAWPACSWAETITVSDGSSIAPASVFGVNVNGADSWYTPLGANLINNACFEGPADGTGLSQSGWQNTVYPASVTASVDTATFTSGAQSQKLVVTVAPAVLQQYHAALPQAPAVMTLTAGVAYVMKAQLKANAAATVQFGFETANGNAMSSPIAITTSWATYSWTYTPSSTVLLNGVLLQMNTVATYWVDDFIAWAPSLTDPTTGLDLTFVSRLKELKPGMLRWGGLGVNGIPLLMATFHPWALSYGPPPITDDVDLGTFLTLCAEVGASAFITVPPAFSTPADAALEDLNASVVANGTADHGNLVDFVGGDATTTWGAIRQAQGYSRFDLQVPKVYYEMGNEVWGTPDGKWDMQLNGDSNEDDMMNTYVTYCTARMTVMKARPGWRSNMRVGFGGANPTMFIGQWPGSYDYTLVPALKALTDFSTINLYYGYGGTGNTDDYIYGGLFAQAPLFASQIATMKSAFATAAGHAVETCMYEGQSKWGPGYSEYAETGTGSYDPMVPKETSLGSGVSLLDNLCAANTSGLTFANVFHMVSDCYGIITQFPNRYRRPDFYALKLFDTYASGTLVASTISGGSTWSDAATSQSAVPTLACYTYLLPSGGHTFILINRSRTTPSSITISKSMTPTTLVELTGASIDLTNDSGEVVVPQTQTLTVGTVSSYTFSLPPFSAGVLVAGEPVVAAPAISPAGGALTGPILVSLSCPTAGAAIHYTTNGTAPTISSPTYTTAFAVSASTTVEALATASGMTASTVTSASFTASSGTTTTGTTTSTATGTGTATATTGTTTTGTGSTTTSTTTATASTTGGSTAGATSSSPAAGSGGGGGGSGGCGLGGGMALLIALGVLLRRSTRR